MSAGSPESTGFLYPFLDLSDTTGSPNTAADAGQDLSGKVTALLADLAGSARSKAEESAALQHSTAGECAELLASTGAEMARRFATGGRMFTCGNGGSSTDAATLAELFARPPAGRALPAWSLAADQAVVTALGNDVGFELVFARQLIARARETDILVAMSTSGSSDDLTAAVSEARRRGLFTVGFAGYDGGRFAADGGPDACFVVRSQSVHRIQESQALLGYQLWATVREHLEATVREHLEATVQECVAGRERR